VDEETVMSAGSQPVFITAQGIFFREAALEMPATYVDTSKADTFQYLAANGYA
jgi:hypothetical protein